MMAIISFTRGFLSESCKDVPDGEGETSGASLQSGRGLLGTLKTSCLPSPLTSPPG